MRSLLLGLVLCGCHVDSVFRSAGSPPDPPTNLQQLRADDAVTVIAVGDTTDAVAVVIEAHVTDPDQTDQVEVELEVRPVGTLNGTPTHFSGLVDRGSTPQVTVDALTEDRDYEWQARTRDNTNRFSVWVSFGGSNGATDFRTSIPEAPDAPEALAQFQVDGTSSIAPGGLDTASSVVLQAIVSDPDPGDFLKLEAEVKPSGDVFDGSGTTLGTATVSSGGTAQVTVSGLLDDTSYDWRVRAIDRDGQPSDWVAFGAGDNDGDFVTAIPDAPNVPTDAAQYESDGTTPLALGATINSSEVVLEARVTDPDGTDQLFIDVEVQPLGTPFTNAATDSGATSVSDGELAQVTANGLSDDTSYHWQVRARDATGRTSGWLSFGNNPESAADFAVYIPEAPNAPTNLLQFKSNGTTALTQGEVTDENTVVLKADVTDPDPGDLLKLEAEVKPSGDVFDGSGTTVGTATVSSGGTAQVTVSGLLDDTSYDWRVRTIDRDGQPSGWTTFGAGDNDGDFRVAIPDPPEAPTKLGQFRSNGSAKLNAGATTTDTDLVFKATVVDPDPLSAIRLEVEVQPLGTPFTNLPTATGLAAVASGDVAQVRVDGLSPGTSYRWQARAVDETDRVSAWVAFGAGDADFIIAP